MKTIKYTSETLFDTMDCIGVDLYYAIGMNVYLATKSYSLRVLLPILSMSELTLVNIENAEYSFSYNETKFIKQTAILKWMLQ